MDAMSITTITLSLAQTVGVISALLFAGYEFRNHRQEQRFRNYLDSIAHSVDVAKLMVENADLHALYEYTTEELTKSYGELYPAEKARVHYCDLIIALCETVWLAGREGWLSKDEWPYWKTWVDQLQGSKDFRWTVRWVRDDYDPDFLAELGLSKT